MGWLVGAFGIEAAKVANDPIERQGDAADAGAQQLLNLRKWSLAQRERAVG